jgi:hypothetical protein
MPKEKKISTSIPGITFFTTSRVVFAAPWGVVFFSEFDIGTALDWRRSIQIGRYHYAIC